MFKLVNVSKYYTTGTQTNLGLRNINLSLEKGEIIAITGESGSGKSTLLNVITKMDSFDEGEIYYKGNETSYFSVDDMDNFRKDKVGFIFQNYNIIDSYTVLENVMLPYTLNGVVSKEAKDKAIELIEKVGLKKRMHNRGSELSGGEKQRCVIARALASNAEVLACDEPTGNLDSKTGVEIIKLIKEIAKDKLVLIVTHNFDLVKDIVTRKIIIHDGEITEDIVYKENSGINEDKELNLDYVPLKRRVSFKVAIKNILKTPRKTILTSLVFFFVCLFALSMYQAILYLYLNEYDKNPFLYHPDDKVLVYDINHNLLNEDYFLNLKNSNLIYDYEFNKFYAQDYIPYYSYKYENTFYIGYQSTNTLTKVDKGRMPEDDSECILLISRSLLEYDSSFLLGETITLNEGFKIRPFDIKVVGLKIVEGLNDDAIMISKNEKFENYLFLSKHIEYSQYPIIATTSLGYEMDLTYTCYFVIDYTKEKSYFKVKSDYSFTSCTIKSVKEGIYILDEDFNIECTPMTAEEEYMYPSTTGVIIIGKDFLNNIDNKKYEAFVYTSSPSLLKEKLENDGYAYVEISKYSSLDKAQKFLNNLEGYFTILMASISLIIIYFISYIILSRIYQTKKKDYTIIRTLGVTKKDMKRIVTYEVLFNSLIITIFTFVLVFLLGKFINKSIFVIFYSIKPLTCILYFTVMFVFAFFIARRFNKKLFKFTVNSTLKAEDLK